jgi:hypothetical protein
MKARPVGPVPRLGDGEGEATSPLRRGISRRMLLFFIVGDILGGGTYCVSPDRRARARPRTRPRRAERRVHVRHVRLRPLVGQTKSAYPRRVA